MAYIGPEPAESFTSFATQEFSTSATTSYTLDHAVANENEIALFINNVRQQPGSGKAYTATGTTLTLSAATASTDTMYCVFLGRALQTVTPVTNSITNAMLSENSQSQIFNNNFRNIIINGDMSQAQRGTSTSSITSNTYSLDRFLLSFSGSIGTWTVAQDTTVPTGQGFATSTKIDCTTADASPASGDRIFYTQRIEGQNLQYLKKGTSSAESLTLSFWVRSNKTGTYIINLYDGDNSRQISKSYTISSADTWEKKELTFAGDTTGAFGNDNAVSLYCNFYLGAGTDYTSGTLATSWESATNANAAVGQVNLADSTSNEWYITGVQLEVGTTATNFEFLPHDVNLQRCQRYCFVKSNGAGALGIATYYSSSSMRASISFPTTMRAAPTLNVTEVSNGYQMNRNSGSDKVDDFTINQANLTEAQIINASDASGTAGQAGTLHADLSTCFLAFISEL
jgi:hypothetical protein